MDCAYVVIGIVDGCLYTCLLVGIVSLLVLRLLVVTLK